LIQASTSQSKPLINNKRLEILIELLTKYSFGDIIYPGVLIRKLNLNMKEVYHLLELIWSLGIIERNFEVFCSKCQKYTGSVYETIKEIPHDYVCEECSSEIGLNPLENTIVVYRVLVE
jgi:hypothetical protein